MDLRQRDQRGQRAVLLRAVLAAAVLGLFPAADSSRAEGVKTLREWSGDGLRIELAPLLPDQVRSFFIARGFSAGDADLIAREGCVFRSAIGSRFDRPGSPMVEVRLDEWKVVHGGTEKPLRTREHWSELWQRLSVEESARVAFYWALFPTRQDFAATDYNWGMLAFGLPFGARFDARIVWRTGGERHETMVRQLECGQ